MSKSPSDRLESLKAKIVVGLGSARDWWTNAATKPRKIVAVTGVVLGVCSIYALSKGDEATKTKVLITREAEFKKSRILGDPYISSSRAKEQILSKTAKEYSDSQRTVLDGLAQINSRIDLIEGKVASKDSAGSQTVTDATSGQSTAPQTQISGNAPGSTPEITPMAGATTEVRDPIDVRPNIPLGRPVRGPYGEGPIGGRVYQTPKGPPVISFPVQGAAMWDRAEVVLPVGSYVKAKLLTGVEAPEGNPYPVLLQLDFANILPNKKSLYMVLLPHIP